MSTPNYPPAVQIKKRRKKWPWIVGTLVLLAILISTTSNKDSKKESSLSSSSGNVQKDDSATGATSKTAIAAKLNQAVRDGKFEFVVTEVAPGVAEIGDNPYLTKKAQGQFIVVSLTVKNIGKKPQSFTPSTQKLFDQEGRSFEPDTAAQIALGDSDIPVWDNINPGNTVTAKIVYDMPKGALPKKIELHDSMFSGGVEVTLK